MSSIFTSQRKKSLVIRSLLLSPPFDVKPQRGYQPLRMHQYQVLTIFLIWTMADEG
jgi:hypothetical protein